MAKAIETEVTAVPLNLHAEACHSIPLTQGYGLLKVIFGSRLKSDLCFPTRYVLSPTAHSLISPSRNTVFIIATYITNININTKILFCQYFYNIIININFFAINISTTATVGLSIFYCVIGKSSLS